MIWAGYALLAIAVLCAVAAVALVLVDAEAKEIGE